jgi:hypothetical protein
MATSVMIGNYFREGTALGASGLVASSTTAGYGVANIRDPNLYTGWRTSSTSDEWVKFHTASSLAFATTFYGLACDCRVPQGVTNNFRTSVVLEYSADDITYYTCATLALSSTFARVCVNYGSFFAPVASARWVRLTFPYTAGKTDTPIVHYFALGATARALVYGSTYDVGPSAHQVDRNVAEARTASGLIVSNQIERQQRRGVLSFRGMTETQRDDWEFQLGQIRPQVYFASLDGMNHFAGDTGACLLRFLPSWGFNYVYTGVSDVEIPYMTEPHSFVRADW